MLKSFALFLGCLLLRLLCRTLRFRVKGDDGFLTTTPTPPSILVLWHNRILVMPYFRARFARHVRLSVLTSASRDGDILARVVNHFGLGAVRGSSSRRGARAVRELHDCLRRGEVVAITPDGPRGPRYQLKPGLIHIAQQADAPIFLAGIEYSRYWELKSWDRFRVPCPFSRVEITIQRAENTEALERQMNTLNRVE